MFEMGARFTNNLYIKLSYDLDSDNCDVAIITINDDNENVVITGSVTWDEDEPITPIG